MTRTEAGRTIERLSSAPLAGAEPVPAAAESQGRGRLLLWLALGAAALAVALVVAFLRPGFGGSSGRPGGKVVPHVSAVIQLRPVLTHVAVGTSGVWVSSVGASTAGNAEAPGLLWRIDPRTNRPASRIPLTTGVDGLALAKRSIWAVDGQSLRRIDPATGRVLHTYTEVAAGKIVAGAGALWAGGQRVDLRTLAVRRLSLPSGAVVAAAGPAGVWAIGDDVYRLDPRTGRVIARIGRSGFRPAAIAESGSSLWIAYASETEWELSSIVRVDPSANAIAGRPINLRGHLPAALAVSGSAVWLLTHNQEEHGARLWQIDLVRGLVGRSLRLPSGTPFLLAAAAHTLWVGEDLDLGTLTRVDLVPR